MQLTQSVSTHTGNRVYIDEDGFRYPSISTLANFFFNTFLLNKWRKRVGYEEAERIKVDSANKGTLIHAAIETNTLTGDDELDQYVEQYQTKIAPYLEIHHQEIVLGHVTPEGYRMAGTCDLIGKWGGELIIGDWKTSPKSKNKNFMGRYSLQLAAYSHSYEFNTDTGIIFNLTPNDAHIFHIPLEEPKRVLTEVVLPNFYNYYREYGHVDKRDRPFPNQYNGMGAYLQQFEKELARTISVEYYSRSFNFWVKL